MNSTRKHLPFLIVWFLACVIGISLRLYPLFNHTSHEISEKATLLVLANLRKRVTAGVREKYPHLSKGEQSRLIKKQFDALLHTERDNARKTIKKVAHRMDGALSLKGNFPYLLASDSYYYFDLTENIQKTGNLGSNIRGSKYLNTLMLAPEGHWEPFNLHPFIGYYIHKIISFFRPGLPLMYTVSFTPLVITALALIPFLFICFLLRCSPLASFSGSICLLMAPIFLKRSSFGWYDNDPYNALFPFTILAVLFYGLAKRHNTKSILLMGCLCASCVCLYALFWQGWVFLESILIASGILILLYNHFSLKETSTSKNLLLYFCVMPLGALIGISIIFGIGEFFVLFREGWIALKNFLQPQLSLWPDLYIGVGELHRASLPVIIRLTGGFFVFAVALWGLGEHLLKILRNQENKENVFPVLILTVFLVFALLVSLGAQRFTLLCLIPISLFFTLGVQGIFDLIDKGLRPKFSGYRHYPLALNLILISIVAIVCVLSIPKTYKKMPSILNLIFNSTWENTLTKIRENTPAASIVNTWWPPGHFIKSTAKRRVTFDGATINKPQAYWLANVFLNPDERQSLGILRMLNTSANKAAEYLVNSGFKLSTAVGILKDITSLTQEKARKKLSGVMDSNQIDTLLNMTHTTPPPSYLLVYNELIEKNIELSFVGNWNFRKMEMLNGNPELRRRVPPSGSREYIQFLWDTVGGQPKYHDPFTAIAQSGDLILFEHNIKIDLKNMDCTINSETFGRGRPQGLFYLKNNRVVEEKFRNASLPFSVVLLKQDDKYTATLMDTSLAKSLMMRLYFFEGKGLKYIHPFLEETDLTGRTHIQVYKVDWEGFLQK